MPVLLPSRLYCRLRVPFAPLRINPSLRSGLPHQPCSEIVLLQGSRAFTAGQEFPEDHKDLKITLPRRSFSLFDCGFILLHERARCNPKGRVEEWDIGLMGYSQWENRQSASSAAEAENGQSPRLEPSANCQISAAGPAGNSVFIFSSAWPKFSPER